MVRQRSVPAHTGSCRIQSLSSTRWSRKLGQRQLANFIRWLSMLVLDGDNSFHAYLLVVLFKFHSCSYMTMYCIIMCDHTISILGTQGLGAYKRN